MGIMSTRVKCRPLWRHTHPKEIASFMVARDTSEALFCDNRDRIAFLAPTGAPLWDKVVDFTPAKVDIAQNGEMLYLTTAPGKLMLVDRKPDLRWDIWIDRETNAFAVRQDGKLAAMGSHRGRIHIINDRGEKIKQVHTAEPVAHVAFAPNTGYLYAASPRGWIGVYDKQITPLGEYRLNETVASIKVGGRGQRIYLPSRDGGVHLVDLESSDMTTFDPGFPVINVGVNVKRGLILAVGLDGDMALINHRGDILWEETTDDSWQFCDINNAGDRFWVASGKGVIACYQMVAGGDPSDGVMAAPPAKRPHSAAPPPAPLPTPLPTPANKPAQKPKSDKKSPESSHWDYLEI